MIKLLQFIFKNKLTYKIIQYYHPFVKSSIHTTVHSYWPMPLEERQKNGASQSNKSGEREKGSCHYTNQEQREKKANMQWLSFLINRGNLFDVSRHTRTASTKMPQIHDHCEVSDKMPSTFSAYTHPRLNHRLE